jgi:hypothetical protein
MLLRRLLRVAFGREKQKNENDNQTATAVRPGPGITSSREHRRSSVTSPP